MLAMTRMIVALATAGLLAGGYFVSQLRYMEYRSSGDPGGMIDYLMRLDESPIAVLSLILILGSIGLCCIPEKGEEVEP